MASSHFILPSINSPLSLQKSPFLGNSAPFLLVSKCPQKPTTSFILKPSAKFDLFQIMGGRGLCRGEEGLQRELKRTVEDSQISASEQEKTDSSPSNTASFNIGEDAFEKELLGLTGGFPGGEKGLKKFIEENPPPKTTDLTSNGELGIGFLSTKPKPPELPLLMPGMIVIVKNPNNPFYMYCGIIQRITDGQAGVLFEGGNWDKLITFRLDELERREKGPPMVNPKSAVLESLVEK